MTLETWEAQVSLGTVKDAGKRFRESLRPNPLKFERAVEQQLKRELGRYFASGDRAVQAVYREGAYPLTTMHIVFTESDHPGRLYGYRFRLWESVEWKDAHLPPPAHDAEHVANEAICYMDDDLMRIPASAWEEGDPSETLWFEHQVGWYS